jgi:hypothetical protein
MLVANRRRGAGPREISKRSPMRKIKTNDFLMMIELCLLDHERRQEILEGDTSRILSYIFPEEKRLSFSNSDVFDCSQRTHSLHGG